LSARVFILSGLEVHVLASGSDGNCTALSSDDVTILIDAGISGKRITNLMGRVGLDPKDLDAILVTHEHSDHVSGAGVMSRKYKVPIVCTKGTFAASNIGEVESHVAISSRGWFEIGHLRVRAMPTSHGAADPCAYAVHSDGIRFLQATDLGKVEADVISELKEADLAVIESNHDINMLEKGPYPEPLKAVIRSDRGHLSNVDCAQALWSTQREGRMVFLAHLSKTNNTPEIARRTVARTLVCDLDSVDCLRSEDDLRTITL